PRDAPPPTGSQARRPRTHQHSHPPQPPTPTSGQHPPAATHIHPPAQEAIMNSIHTTPPRQQHRNLFPWFTHPSSPSARPSDRRLRAARKPGSRLLARGLLPACAVVASVALVTVPSANVTARAASAATHPDASTTHTLKLTARAVASHRVGTRGLVVFDK